MLPEAVELVTPGIRTGDEPPDDQKRTLTAKQAIEAGANWLVVGRPIYANPNPRKAAEAIAASSPTHCEGLPGRADPGSRSLTPWEQTRPVAVPLWTTSFSMNRAKRAACDNSQS
jgi:hypothetical protein